MEPQPPPPLPHIPIVVALLFAVLVFLPSAALSINITSLLSPYPDVAAFAALLTTASVARDLSQRSSLTLLAVPNPVLQESERKEPFASSPYDLADAVRYHVLLQYLSPSDLEQIPQAGKVVTTLFQTTGRASSNMGAVNLTRDPLTGSVTVGPPAPFSSSNATILALLKTLPYNVSVFTVDSLLVPSGMGLAASQGRPPPPLNITRVLIDGGDFNVAASMLAASGVADEFEADERGAGITIFVPTDEAFAELPKTGDRLQSLPADQKAVVLRFHVLHSYYPLGSLESIVNPVQPTLATEDTGAGRFTLNISRVNGSVAIDTGIVQASITRTVFDQNPVAVFAVSNVLLPREIFGSNGGVRTGSEILGAAAPPPDGINYPPSESPPMGVDFAPARLSTPPGLRQIRSGVAHIGFDTNPFSISSFCIGLVYVVLV